MEIDTKTEEKEVWQYSRTPWSQQKIYINVLFEKSLKCQIHEVFTKKSLLN